MSEVPSEEICEVSAKVSSCPSIKEKEKNQKSFPELLAFALMFTKEKIEAQGKILEGEMSL